MLVGIVGAVKSVSTDVPAPVPDTAVVAAAASFPLKSVCKKVNPIDAPSVSFPARTRVIVRVVPETSVVDAVCPPIDAADIVNPDSSPVATTVTVSPTIAEALAPL